MSSRGVVLMLGSAPQAVELVGQDLRGADLAVINNAWQVRGDWAYAIFPEDFPEDRRPEDVAAGQRLVTAEDFVPAMNAFGGVVWCGGTMAFTAGYWVLHALKPDVLAYFACDMVYAEDGDTHFYGTGAADPLRDDPTLRSLEAKSARLGVLAARQGCACVNLSDTPSRLLYPRVSLDAMPGARPPDVDGAAVADLLRQERACGYDAPSGRYWEQDIPFDTDLLDRIDAGWRALYAAAVAGAS